MGKQAPTTSSYPFLLGEGLFPVPSVRGLLDLDFALLTFAEALTVFSHYILLPRPWPYYPLPLLLFSLWALWLLKQGQGRHLGAPKMSSSRHMYQYMQVQFWPWDGTLEKWKKKPPQKNSLVSGPGSILQSEDDISGKQLQLDF